MAEAAEGRAKDKCKGEEGGGADDEWTVIQGRCYCGSVTWESRLPPGALTNPMYCHCSSCRIAHATPLYQVCYIKDEHFSYKSGLAEGLVKDTHMNPKLSRQFSACCGTRTVNRLTFNAQDAERFLKCLDSTHLFYGCGVPGRFVGLFPGNTINNPLPSCFESKKHLWCEEAILVLDKLKDDLVRYDQE